MAVIDLRRPQEQSPIVSGLQGMLQGLNTGMQQRQSTESLIKNLSLLGFEPEQAMALGSIPDEKLRSMMIEKMYAERSRQKGGQSVAQYLMQQGVPEQQAQAIAAIPDQSVRNMMIKNALGEGQKAQGAEAIDAMLAQTALTDEQKNTYKNLVASGQNQQAQEYIKSLTVDPAWWSKIFGATKKHPFTPGGPVIEQKRDQQIAQVAQQLKGSGYTDQEIEEIVRPMVEEQESFSPLRALGGAATGALATGGVRALSSLIPGVGPMVAAGTVADVVKGLGNVAGRAMGAEKDVMPGWKDFLKFYTQPTVDMEDYMRPEEHQMMRESGVQDQEAPVPNVPSPFVSLGDVTEGVRNVAEAAGFETKPKTYAERKIASLGGALPLIFNPALATQEGVATALKNAGVQAGLAEGAGALTKTITGSELLGEGVTGLGYLAATRYPRALNKYKDEKYTKWNDALKKAKDKTIPAEVIQSDFRDLERGIAERVNPYDIPGKFMQRYIRNFEDKIKRNAQGEPSLNVKELWDLRKVINSPHVFSKAKKYGLQQDFKEMRNIIDKGLDYWGQKNNPEALGALRTALDVDRTMHASNIVSDNLRQVSKINWLALNPKTLAIKAALKGGMKTAAAFTDEIGRLAASPSIRSAWFDLIKAGANNNKAQIALMGDRLFKQLKGNQNREELANRE